MRKGVEQDETKKKFKMDHTSHGYNLKYEYINGIWSRRGR